MKTTPTLHYRLTDSKSGCSFTASTSDPALHHRSYAITLAHVAMMFKEHQLPGVNTDGMVPEVLTAETMARIDALEAALENCRNLMLEIDPPTQDEDQPSEWAQAIDEAADLLGY